MGQTVAGLCPLSEAAAAHHGPFRPLRVSDAQLVCCNWVMLPTLGVKLERHRKTDVSQRNVAALQRQAAANQIMAILPRGCRAALPRACRAKTPCRVSVVAVTVRAAGASGTWDIYSQIASRLKLRPGGRGPPREENCSSDFCSEEKESLCHNPLGPWDVFYGVWGWSLVCGSLRVAGL